MKQLADDRLDPARASHQGDDDGAGDDGEPRKSRAASNVKGEPVETRRGRVGPPGRVPLSRRDDRRNRPIFDVPGLPSTVLPPADPAAAEALAEPWPLGRPPRAALAAVAADWPRYLDVWAELGDRRDESSATPPTASATTVASTRCAPTAGGIGLRALAQPTNQGFLRGLAGLGAMAAAIGEADEADASRCSCPARPQRPAARRTAAAVLCGGASRPMGRTSRWWCSNGIPWRCGSPALGAAGCEPVISSAATPRCWHARPPTIADRWPGEGPLGGVLTALLDSPRRRRASWWRPLRPRPVGAGSRCAS